MNVDRWERTKEILEGALHLAPEQRLGYLASTCGQDAALRTEVESLIASYEEAGSHFLETSASGLLGLSPSGNPPVDRTNKIIGQYRLVQELGRGGMGVVYVGEDLRLGRKVAIKFLPGELSNDATAFERFEREARAASALDHRNICSIYQFGEFEGQPFIVMQLLEGQTLREWIETEPYPNAEQRQQQLIDIAIQIADGLDAAHQKGIIHRDIKPANIFLTNRGEVKILDFGVAKFREVSETAPESAPSLPPANLPENLTLTGTGIAVGTPSYLSPEQIRGEKLDARTDLFSVGLVLYEMATGGRTFAGSTLARMRGTLNTSGVPARELNPGLSPKLDVIIEKALEQERERRFQSALELRSALEELRTQLAPSAKQRRKKQLWLASAAVVLVLGVISYLD